MAAKDLVTLEEFKVYKTINSTEQDDKINALITRVSQFIKTYCGKTFVDYVSTDKTEYYDAVNTSDIFLDEQPVISITSLQVSNDGGKTYNTALVEYDDFFVNYDIGVVTSTSTFTDSSSSSVSQGVSSRSLKVKYRGGYKTLPADLRQAALDMVEYYRANEYTPRQDFQSFKIENLGFRTGDSPSLPSHIKRILDQYREL